MKKSLSFFLLVSCFISCDIVFKSIDNPYKNAYSYVVKNMLTKRKYIAVCDSLSAFDKYMAINLLGLDHSYLAKKATIYHTSDSLLGDVPVYASNPVHLLLFSRMEDNMITAEVVNYQMFKKFKGSRFTTIIKYLFVFDERMRIKKVFYLNIDSE